MLNIVEENVKCIGFENNDLEHDYSSESDNENEDNESELNDKEKEKDNGKKISGILEQGQIQQLRRSKRERKVPDLVIAMPMITLYT